MSPPSRRRAALLVVAGAATWGTTGTSQALADVAASPVAVGAARTVVGAVALVVVAAALGDLRRPGAASTVPRGALAVAAIAIAAYQALFFAGVDATGVAIGTVVGIGSVPVLTGLVTWVADRVRPTPRWWGATALAIVGAVLVLGSADETSVVDAVGVVLSLGAGLAYAILTVAARRLLDAGLSPTGAMARVFALGAVPSAVLLVAVDASGLVTGRGVALVAWLAVVTVGVGYALYASGLRVLPPPTVGTLTLTEPLVAAVLGIAVLGERPTVVAFAGIVALTAGLVVMATDRPAT